MRISDWSSDVFSSDLVQQSGIELVSELKEREAEAIDLARSLNLPEVSAVFWFSSTSIKADPFVAGRKGAPGYLMDQLGIENVIESDEDWPTVAWESIAKYDQIGRPSWRARVCTYGEYSGVAVSIKK